MGWQALHNLIIEGKRPRSDVAEGPLLWDYICTVADTYTPRIEFDFFGSDIWKVMGAAPIANEVRWCRLTVSTTRVESAYGFSA